MAGIKNHFLYVHTELRIGKGDNHDLIGSPLVYREKDKGFVENLFNINSTFTIEYGGSI